MHKALLTFAMLLVTSLLVTSPVLFLITTLPQGEQPRECAVLDEACIRERDGAEGVCETRACKEAAQRILLTMQRSTDPCQDFYKFACGRYRDPQPYEPTSTTFSSLQENVDDRIQRLLQNETGRMSGVFEKLGHFYNSCLEFEERPVDFAPVWELLGSLEGGYLGPGAQVPEGDLTRLVATLLRVSGTPIFDLYLDADLYDQLRPAVFLDLPKKYKAEVFFEDILLEGPRWRKTLPRGKPKRRTARAGRPGPLQHPDENRPGHQQQLQQQPQQQPLRPRRSYMGESKEYLLIKTKREEQRTQRILRMIEGLLPKELTEQVRARELDELLQFCLAISKIYPRHKDIYNWIDIDQRIYEPYNLTHLEQSFSFISWRLLLNLSLDAQQLGLYAGNAGPQDDSGPEYVYVTAPHYFRSLDRLLARFPKRTIHNGLLVLYAADTLYDVANVSEARSWSDECVRLTKNVFPEVVGALYVQQFTPEFLDLLTNRVGVLFERIKETLAERMLVMPWLDEETRTQAIFRLRALRGKFKLWPGYVNETSLGDEMAQVKIEPENFFGSMIERFRQIRTSESQLRRNATQKWHHPFTVNAYYEASSNSIVIPLAMMQAWFWGWEGGPAYSVYATLGSVMSHEMLHAFDLHHRRAAMEPEPSNEPTSWITPEAWRRLEVMIECVAKLYARSFWRKVKFSGDSVDVQFDWNVTRNENVADIGSLQIAYQTWHTLTNGKDRGLPGLEGLRPNQLFFISAAQTYCSNMTAEAYILSVELDYHTPQPERVNGIMMNSPEFAEAFRCAQGTKMNPPKKCRTW